MPRIRSQFLQNEKTDVPEVFTVGMSVFRLLIKKITHYATTQHPRAVVLAARPRRQHPQPRRVSRQKDCERNAVSMVARTLFSDKELEGKSTEERKQMMAEKHKVDWNLILSFYRKGVCVRKYECVETFTRPDDTTIKVPRKRWNVAKCIPSFQEHPEYINELVNI